MNKKNDIKTLIAGAWIGEFGWELFCWQGYVRRMSKKYDNTVIICRKGHEFLYKDFANEFYNVNADTKKANMWLGENKNQEVNQIIKKVKPTDHLKPFNIGYVANGITTNITNEKFNQQDYVKYKSDSLDKKYDILLHTRNKLIGSDRNWEKDNWVFLVKLLKKDGYSIATIGSNEAFKIEGVDDYRNISIEDTVSLMNRSKLVVGQSSGPLHLASLSGAKHFVWSSTVNKKRYQKHWNPFNTEVIFYDQEQWHPNVINVYNGIIENI